jgi:sugar O-acyltransferase (sialic acid O-acetyltransferase NeuD family)
MKNIAIYGAGGFGLEVAQLIEQINEVKAQWKLVGFFDNWKHVGDVVNGYSILGGLREINEWKDEINLVIALGMPQKKIDARRAIESKKVHFPALVHPSAVVGGAKHVELGEGSIVCAGCIITTNVIIGRHVILNLSCTVGHQTRIGDYCSFMPSCNISGEVEVGEGVYFGTGAKIINGKKIGAHSVVGAGAVVITDLPERCTAVGVPAKPIKQS